MIQRETDRGMALGAVTIVVAAGIYWVTREQAGHPLAMMVIPPLLTAVLSTTRRTAVIAVAALVAAGAIGAAAGMSGEPLVARLGIIAVGSALAVVAAEVRERQTARFEAAQVQLALAQTFQIGLVPTPNPSPGLSATIRYVPGERGLLLGGDFLEVIHLPDGTTGFVIGDVTGHGPRAAAFGTAVRAGWKSVAYSRPDDLGGWLDDVEAAFFHDHRFDGFVTALSGHVDPRTGTVRLVSAGHPWPVELTDGAATLLELEVSPPLGVGRLRPRPVTETTLDARHGLLCYTDGIMENAWSPGGRSGEDGLLRAVDELGGSADLDQLLARLGPRGFQDDVALLLLRMAGSA